MNESTSYFVYALSDTMDRCDYLKFKTVWDDKARRLDWKLTKSELNYNGYTDDYIYLFTAEQVPGGEKKFIKAQSINRKLYSEMFSGGYSPVTAMLQKMVESVDEPLPTQDEAELLIDRTNNIFKNIDMWMQPGAVIPSHFNVVKIPSFYGQGWNIWQYMNKINPKPVHESGTEPMYIPPRKGTSCEATVFPGGTVGLDRTTNGVGIIPLGEDLEEELEVGYRGSWFMKLWRFLYEDLKGESMFVVFDVDDSEYYTAFELPSALSVSSCQEIAKDKGGVVEKIRGHNLHILSKLLDKLREHGNPGHTFTWFINKDSSGKYAFRDQFDGDGGDYIFRISLTQTNIKK